MHMRIQTHIYPIISEKTWNILKGTKDRCKEKGLFFKLIILNWPAITLWNYAPAHCGGEGGTHFQPLHIAWNL